MVPFPQKALSHFSPFHMLNFNLFFKSQLKCDLLGEATPSSVGEVSSLCSEGKACIYSFVCSANMY